MLYRIEVQFTRASSMGWTEAGALPTFYLHSAVQGIEDAAGAERVARRILRHGENPGAFADGHGYVYTISVAALSAADVAAGLS